MGGWLRLGRGGRLAAPGKEGCEGEGRVGCLRLKRGGPPVIRDGKSEAGVDEPEGFLFCFGFLFLIQASLREGGVSFRRGGRRAFCF